MTTPIGESLLCPAGTTPPPLARVLAEQLAARLGSGNPPDAQEVLEDIQRLVQALDADEAARAEAQRALRESEERFRQMASSIREVFWMADLDGGHALYVSPAFEHIWGRPIPPAGLRLAEWLATIHPEDRPRALGWLESSDSAGTEIEYRIVRADGALRWIRDRVFPVSEEDAGSRRIAGVAEDVTERRAVAEALQTSERRMRTVVENLEIVLFALDAEGVFTFSEGRGLEALGLQPGQVVGQSVFELYRDEPEVLEHVRLALSGKRHSAVVRLRSIPRVYESHYTPLLDASGAVCQVIGAAIDQTERVQLEHRLALSQKLDSVGRLAGGVAHDFNNLLTIMLGYAELIEATLAEESAATGYVQQIQKAALRAGDLTRQLLAFARRQAIAPRVLEVNRLIQEVAGLLPPVLGPDIEVQLHLRPDAGCIRVDPGQFEQVLVNLAINARDAMPHGGTLTIESQCLSFGEEDVARHVMMQPGSYAFIAVSDTGSGIPADVLPHIFEPFFTTKPEGQGTGLGLATCYGVVKQSGGFIWAYSEPGTGATFRLYFPLVDNQEGSPTAPPAAPADGGGCETILIAEDEEMVRLMAVRTLAQMGYRVLDAANGEEALNAAANHAGDLDLLLTDVVMPRMGGPELARRLRELRPGTRVLYMSGYTQGAVQSQGLGGQEVELLHKPFTPRGLAAKVRAVLDARPQHSED